VSRPNIDSFPDNYGGLIKFSADQERYTDHLEQLFREYRDARLELVRAGTDYDAKKYIYSLWIAKHGVERTYANLIASIQETTDGN
jgi:hypothetical protein